MGGVCAWEGQQGEEEEGRIFHPGGERGVGEKKKWKGCVFSALLVCTAYSKVCARQKMPWLSKLWLDSDKAFLLLD